MSDMTGLHMNTSCSLTLRAPSRLIKGILLKLSLVSDSDHCIQCYQSVFMLYWRPRPDSGLSRGRRPARSMIASL